MTFVGHRPSDEPDTRWNPVPVRPPTLLGLLVLIRSEWRAELPLRLHVHQVPDHTEPIPVLAGHPEGATLDVTDSGPLGGAAWSMPAHRRFGAVTMWEAEQTIDADDYRIFPFAYALERRIPGWCRRRHANRPELYLEHRGQPICHPVLRQLIATEQPIGSLLNVYLPLHYQMTPDRLARVVDEGLRYLWRAVSDTLNEIDLGKSVRARVA